MAAPTSCSHARPWGRRSVLRRGTGMKGSLDQELWDPGTGLGCGCSSSQRSGAQTGCTAGWGSSGPTERQPTRADRPSAALPWAAGSCITGSQMTTQTSSWG